MGKYKSPRDRLGDELIHSIQDSNKANVDEQELE